MKPAPEDIYFVEDLLKDIHNLKIKLFSFGSYLAPWTSLTLGCWLELEGDDKLGLICIFV